MIPNRRRLNVFGSLSKALTPSLALAVVACGGYGGGGGNTTPPLTPTVNLSVQPTTITAGQSATLTWSTTNAGTCTAEGAWSGTQATTGTQSVTPSVAGSSQYTLTCTAPSGSAYGGGGGGSGSMSATLTVNAASAFTVTKLVADSQGTGAVSTDTNLANPWGIAVPLNGAAWVADNHTRVATIYDGNGKAQPAANPRVVHLPPGPGTVTFDPTGIVSNSSSVDFVVSSGTNSNVARFIFAGEGGMIAGWSSTVSPDAVITYADAGGAVYKGLALAKNGTANFLYATDFHNNKVDVFDATSPSRRQPRRALLLSTRHCRPATPRSESRRSRTVQTARFNCT